jgi:3-phosphoshikimate 1-carboxyvinyltransferase
MSQLSRNTFTVDGALAVPGDKSLSHRALIFAALAEGRSCIRGLLDSADVRATAGALQACGVHTAPAVSDLAVTGVGHRGLHAPAGDIDCGNSGTSARLLAGVLAAHPFRSRLTGDASLSRRPMRRVAAPLAAMGATLRSDAGDGLPIVIEGGDLHGVSWTSDVASAQVKSAVLLAGYCAGAEVSVTEPALSRDHTERMMRAFGADVVTVGCTASLAPRGSMRAFDMTVPGDPSSAAFFIALAALADRGTLRLTNVGLNPTRTGFLDLVRQMGADVRITDEHESGCEPVGTITAAPAALRGIAIDPATIPRAIDELPLIAILGARAEGETTVSGAGELRVKESDRIAAVVANLRAIGAQAEEHDDGFTVVGSDAPLRGTVRTHGDHRIAMAFGILAALPGTEITIDDRDCVAVSYPNFWTDVRSATGAS